MTMEQLPPKGIKREQAILELVKNEARMKPTANCFSSL